MRKLPEGSTLVLLLGAMFLAVMFVAGYFSGYLHVIKNSEAYHYLGDNVVTVCVDGHAYEYVIDPLQAMCL